MSSPAPQVRSYFVVSENAVPAHTIGQLHGHRYRDRFSVFGDDRFFHGNEARELGHQAVSESNLDDLFLDLLPGIAGAGCP